MSPLSALPPLGIPRFLKRRADAPLPTDAVYDLVAGNGLFRCRNSRYFASSVLLRPLRAPPLADHAAFYLPRFPRLPNHVFHPVVAFFAELAEQFCSEGMALILLDAASQECSVAVPVQTGYVACSQLGLTPLQLRYQFPVFPASAAVIGSIHSHASLPAYTSQMDYDDMLDVGGGLHIVIGHLPSAAPQILVETCVDHQMFTLDPPPLFERGFDRLPPGTAFPPAWRENFQIRFHCQ